MRLGLRNSDRVLALGLQRFNKGHVRIPIITDHNPCPLRMFSPDTRQKPLRRGQFTILGRALRCGVPDFFPIQREHLRGARLDDCRSDDQV